MNRKTNFADTLQRQVEWRREKAPQFSEDAEPPKICPGTLEDALAAVRDLFATISLLLDDTDQPHRHRDLLERLILFGEREAERGLAMFNALLAERRAAKEAYHDGNAA